MATILLDLGPLAHLSVGDGPLLGSAMSDDQVLVEPAGMGLLIEDGVIQRITSSDSLREEFIDSQRGSLLEVSRIDGVEVIEAGGRAVLPGLVDSHTHLLWGGDRSQEIRWRLQGASYSEIAQRGGGIAHSVTATRSMSIEKLISSGEKRIDRAIVNGTTSLEAKSGYGLDTESELRLLRAATSLTGISLDPTWLGAHAVPDEMAIGDYVEQILSEQLPAVIESGNARSADVFCEPGWFSLEQTEDICDAAKAGGLDIRLHVDEFSDGGGLSLAAELGAQSADHVHHSDPESRQKAHEAGTMQCFLPGTPFSLGDEHWPPISQCIEDEQAWCAATDFNPNCPTLSLPFIGSLLCVRMGIDPLAALVAVSRNPAHTTRHERGLRHGRIVEGGAADINILDSEHWESWCQRPGDSPFAATMIGGEWHHH